MLSEQTELTKVIRDQCRVLFIVESAVESNNLVREQSPPPSCAFYVVVRSQSETDNTFVHFHPLPSSLSVSWAR